MDGGDLPPEEWSYRSMKEGRKFETWYQRNLEVIVPWEGVRRGDRRVESLGRAIFFKEGERVVASVVFDFDSEDEAPRRWYDTEEGGYRSMEGVQEALREKIRRFLEGAG